MRPLRYSINVTLDGCVDHRAVTPTAETHRHAEETVAQAGALLFGRVTYQMMEEGWRPFIRSGVQPDWMDDWMVPFAHAIDAAPKFVVSRTLDRVDWNAELVRGDLEATVRRLKAQPGKGILTGGVTLPLALAELALIDEYEFVIHPVVAGHGPTLLAGLSRPLALTLVQRRELSGGVVACTYRPAQPSTGGDTVA